MCREHYLRATQMMGRPAFADVLAETKELWQDKSLEELSDVIHSASRYLRVPDKVTWVIANKTARKHAVRMQMYGCPRSRRNCRAAGETCCCKR